MTAPSNTKDHPAKRKTESDNTDQIFDNTEIHVSENNLFSLTFNAIKNAKTSSKADNKRAKRLNDVLTEFQNINNTPAHTPEQMALKSRKLCELIAKNKDIFLKPQETSA